MQLKPAIQTAKNADIVSNAGGFFMTELDDKYSMQQRSSKNTFPKIEHNLMSP